MCKVVHTRGCLKIKYSWTWLACWQQCPISSPSASSIGNTTTLFVEILNLDTIVSRRLYPKKFPMDKPLLSVQERRFEDLGPISVALLCHCCFQMNSTGTDISGLCTCSCACGMIICCQPWPARLTKAGSLTLGGRTAAYILVYENPPLTYQAVIQRLFIAQAFRHIHS